MKIAAIQGYTNKGYNTGFGKKEENQKKEIHLPHSTKVSILKMLPVMMAMAGMQPVAAATTLSSDSPQQLFTMPQSLTNPDYAPRMYPPSDSRYDPQYDGESKYLHLNLNELFYYVFNNMRTPKLIDMNSLFDRYVQGRVNWDKFKRDNNMDLAQMSMVQRGIAYFENLYKLRELESRDAIRDGKPDPYSEEALAKQPRLRAHYLSTNTNMSLITEMPLQYMYITPAMTTALNYPPYAVEAKLNLLQEKEAFLNEDIDEDDYSGNNNLEYKHLTEDVRPILPGLAGANKNTGVSSQAASRNGAVNNDISDFEADSGETALVNTVHNDLQNILSAKGIARENVQILEQTDENIKAKVKTNSFTTLLTMRQPDEMTVYASGVLQTDENHGSKKMEMLTMADGKGNIIYSLFRDLDTDNVYCTMMGSDNKVHVIDFTEEGKQATILDMGKILEDDMKHQYYATKEDIPGDLSYFAEHDMFKKRDEVRTQTYYDGMEMEDYFTLDMNTSDGLDMDAFPDDLLTDETDTSNYASSYVADDAESGDSSNSTTVTAQAPKSSENELSDAELQAKIIAQAEQMLAEKEAREKEEQQKRNLPIILGLTALGGAAVGAGGKKALEALKDKNINIKDAIMRMKQKFADNVSTAQTYKSKNTGTEDPKKTYWK